MHPAYSIIFFTAASGAGYGLLFLLGIAAAIGLPSAMTLWYGPAFAVSLVLALGLVSAGLVSSAFHLGRPERALRAFTQWRTSWLSREACLAAATYVPAILLGFGWWREEPIGVWRWSGFLLAAGSVATVYSTAMIYRSLPAVPRWSTFWVPVNYLALAAASGAVWLAFISALFGYAAPLLACSPSDDFCEVLGFAVTPSIAFAATVLLAVAAAAKWQYWRAVRRLPAKSTIGSATGLDRLGPGARVHVLDPPHTQTNWLQREMGYQVARRHARRLRAIVWVLAFIVPGVLCLAVWLGGESGGAALIAALGVAAVSASAGILIERWLFFAEAEHKMSLYYGKERV